HTLDHRARASQLVAGRQEFRDQTIPRPNARTDVVLSPRTRKPNMLSDALQAQARTVAHLAVYFEELKQAALRLREQFGARQRGFFSPREDEAARQLLVSYWMARSALFEVVIDNRDADEVPESLRPARFLIAYAAAVLLVDAGR